MYHPQMDMFPWCSSMQFVKLLVAREQLGPHWSFWGCCVACGEAWAGASAEPPPPNMPPIAWPIEEPTATPLYVLFSLATGSSILEVTYVFEPCPI